MRSTSSTGVAMSPVRRRSEGHARLVSDILRGGLVTVDPSVRRLRRPVACRLGAVIFAALHVLFANQGAHLSVKTRFTYKRELKVEYKGNIHSKSPNEIATNRRMKPPQIAERLT